MSLDCKKTGGLSVVFTIFSVGLEKFGMVMRALIIRAVQGNLFGVGRHRSSSTVVAK